MTELLRAKDAREKTAKALEQQKAKSFKNLMQKINEVAMEGRSSISYPYLLEGEKDTLEELGYRVEQRTKKVGSSYDGFSYYGEEEYYLVSW